MPSDAVRYDSWTESLEALKNGEADFIGANVADEEFKKDYIFTRPYFSFPNVIVTRTGISGSVRLEELAGKQVVSVAGWPETNLLRAQYPEMEVVEVTSSEEGLIKVAFGEYDYILTYLPTAVYIIESRSLSGLRVAGYMPGLVEGAIMVRKNLPVLRDIFQKTLYSIAEEKRLEMRI